MVSLVLKALTLTSLVLVKFVKIAKDLVFFWWVFVIRLEMCGS